MKKFITVILTVLYVFTSTGATLQMHYCMGQLADWGVGHIKSESCGKCGMKKTNEKSGGCCKDEYKVFKNDNHKKTAENVLQDLQLFAVSLPPWPVTIQTNYFPGVKAAHPMSHAPPGRYNVAVYIRNCAFLI